MTRPMEGVRILEVAQFTFVPAGRRGAGRLGRRHHQDRARPAGDAQRGLGRFWADVASAEARSTPSWRDPTGASAASDSRSEKPRRRPVARTNSSGERRVPDEFSSRRPRPARHRRRRHPRDQPRHHLRARQRIRPAGARGEKGGYDSTAFWARGGSALGVTTPDLGQLCQMPAGAYGDAMGGMTIAGGIAAALYARQRTGEPSSSTCRCSASGAWATQFSVNLAFMMGGRRCRPSAAPGTWRH